MDDILSLHTYLIRMEGIDVDNFIYLSVLFAALSFYLLLSQRRHIGRMVRHLTLWILIFIGVMASIGLWEDLRPRIAPTQIIAGDGIIEVERGTSGHYSVRADVNGSEIDFLVDTGASNIVLSRRDALAAGFDVDNLIFTGRAQTANGIVKTAPVHIDTLYFGGIEEQNIKAYVTDGELFGSLLGMDYLSRFEKIEIQRGKLILTR